MSISVMVVDDEPDVAELFRQQFRREERQSQYVMHFVASAEEALEKLDDGIRPELIVVLSDINMPGMDGLELLQEVTRHKIRPAFHSWIHRHQRYRIERRHQRGDSRRARVLLSDRDGIAARFDQGVVDSPLPRGRDSSPSTRWHVRLEEPGALSSGDVQRHSDGIGHAELCVLWRAVAESIRLLQGVRPSLVLSKPIQHSRFWSCGESCRRRSSCNRRSQSGCSFRWVVDHLGQCASR